MHLYGISWLLGPRENSLDFLYHHLFFFLSFLIFFSVVYTFQENAVELFTHNGVKYVILVPFLISYSTVLSFLCGVDSCIYLEIQWLGEKVIPLRSNLCPLRIQ